MTSTTDLQQKLFDYQPEPSCLADRIIVITGATGSIGRAVSLGCANAGATVVLVGRDMQKLEAVYDEIEQAGGPKPAIFPINFEHAAAPDYVQLHDALAEEFGVVDGLLNNAGMLGPKTPIEQYHIESWQTVFKVNTTAPFLMTKCLLPLLKKSADASVIFTGSSVGYAGRAYWGAYAASKAACENLMQTLADEYSEVENIRFNSFNPGATCSVMRAEAYPAEDPNSVAAPEDHISKYLFLLSSASKKNSGRQFAGKA